MKIDMGVWTLIKGKHKTKGIRMSSHGMVSCSYNFVTSFETFDSWSNLYDLSCHISTFSNRKYNQQKAKMEDFPKFCNTQPSAWNSAQ